MNEIVQTGLFRVYRASAGSGKTYTLVREYLKLALQSNDPYYFRHILAITFTNKAAGEMKERVLRHLESLGSNDNESAFNSNLLNDYCQACSLDAHTIRVRAGKTLKAMLHRYSDLSILTIDKFIHKILRNFSRDLHLQLDFELSTDEEALLQEAIDDLLSEVGSNELLTKVILDFTLHKTDQESNWDISQELFSFGKILFREDSIDPVLELRKLNSNDFLLLREKCFERMHSIRNKVASLAGEAIKLLEENNLDAENFSYKMAGPVALFYKFRHGHIHEWVPGQRIREVIEKDNWYSKSESPEVKAAIENVKQDLNRLNRFILEIYDDKFGEYKLYRELSSSLFSLALLQEIDLRMERMKDERNILLLSDFNRKISSIVLTEHAPFIYERIGEKYHHIFIDEFQDTSVTQWQNFIPLFENSLSEGNNCMLVGDPKQSIYRFRNGEMEQLVHLPEFYKHRNNEVLLEKQELFRHFYAPVSLDVNYRSRQEIVSFNNGFFDNFFNFFQGGLRKVYENSSQQYLPGNSGGYVELHFIDTDNAEEDKRQKQIEKTLAALQDCLADNYQFKDITVLVRKNSEGSKIASALSDNGIPVISQDSLLIGTSPEVCLVASCMIWLSDFRQEAYKARLAENYLKIYFPEEDLAAELFRHRKDKFTDIIAFFRERNILISPASLLREPLYIIAEKICDLFSIHKAKPFINAFLDVIFQNNSISDLNSFREWWEEKGQNTPVKIPEGTDAVKVMTIHKSKGLQFPVVIIPFADWEMKPQRKELWVETGELLTPLQYALVGANENVFHSLNQDFLLNEENEKTLLDNINSLYVAFTRPEERLYVFSRKVNSEKNTFSWLQKCSEGITSDGAEENGISTSGKRMMKSAEERKESIPEFGLTTNFSSDWQEKIRISFEWKKSWGDGQAYSSAEYGNVLHEILSKITGKEDIHEKANEILSGRMYPEEMKKDILDALSRFSQHDFFEEIYAPDKIVKTECEIIDRDGNSYRPDRLVIENDQALLIDFKTGKRKQTHHDQICQYGTLLNELGYSRVEKYLFYTAENHLVKVS